MTNEERYVRAFSVLQPEEGWMERLETGMSGKQKRRGRGLLAVLAAVVALAVLFGAAYAADLGGIQGRVRLWHLGKAADMDVKLGWSEDGAWGAPHRMYVFSDEDGREVLRIPVAQTDGKTTDEILEEVQDQMVSFDARNCILSEDNRQVLEWANGDHSIYIHYFGKSINVGDYFDENGFGRFEGEIRFGKYVRWVALWRSPEEPWWHFVSHGLDEEP